MTLITKDTDYAVRALCYMAQNGGVIVTVSELSSVLEIPRPFLRRILQTLNKKRVLRSHKGRNGGFQLGKPAHKIFLVDLIVIFQGPVKLTKCVIRKSICPDVRTCFLRKKIKAIEKFVESELESTTVASLLAEGKKGT